MAISWEYPFLTPQDYFALCQFNAPRGNASVTSFLAQKDSGTELRVNRVEVSQKLALRILEFILKDGLSTRGPVPDVTSLNGSKMSRSIFTVFFTLHCVAGERGGWFVLERGGREPEIKDEFIQYGPMRKSGGRKNRYRRKLSYSEQNQVDHLKGITPTLDQMLVWILKKYQSDIRNLDFYAIA